MQARSFSLIIDEPTELGGTDEGANPVEYLLAALCGCLNVVAHVVAKEMDFQLRGLEIRAEGELNPAKFLGQSDAERAGYQEVKVKLIPDADAEKKTLEKWLQVVEERCPVSDNIANATLVSLSLA